MSCKHLHGDFVKPLGSWVCGQCFQMIERPVKYRAAPPRPLSSPFLFGPQEIAWIAEIRKSKQGLTLSEFMGGMARVLRRRLKVSETEAFRLALAELEIIGDEFGNPIYEWSYGAAREMARECVDSIGEEYSGDNA